MSFDGIQTQKMVSQQNKIAANDEKISANEHLGRNLKWNLNIIWLTLLKSPPETFLKFCGFFGGDQKKNIAPGIPCVAWF